jgi:hypothetical protein
MIERCRSDIFDILRDNGINKKKEIKNEVFIWLKVCYLNIEVNLKVG